MSATSDTAGAARAVSPRASAFFAHCKFINAGPAAICRRKGNCTAFKCLIPKTASFDVSPDSFYWAHTPCFNELVCVEDVEEKIRIHLSSTRLGIIAADASRLQNYFLIRKTKTSDMLTKSFNY